MRKYEKIQDFKEEMQKNSGRNRTKQFRGVVWVRYKPSDSVGPDGAKWPIW